MKLQLLVLLAIWGYLLPLHAQEAPIIQIGKPYPNPAGVKVQALVANKTVSLSTWKGKPLIVDFFSSHCVVCFKSLPKIKKLQEEFKEDMRFLLIGKEDSMIRKIYGRFDKKLDLKLDVAYDSLLHKDLREYSYPLYVWIGSDGIVSGVTGWQELTPDNISRFIKTNMAPSPPKKIIIDYDPKKPLLVNSNGGNSGNFMFRSIISVWETGAPMVSPLVIRYDQLRDSLQLLGLSINELYMYAYFGELIWSASSPLYKDVFPNVIKENGEILRHTKNMERYCYSVWRKGNFSQKMNIQKRFQYDLDIHFGFNAAVENRLMPYYSLTLREGFKKKLETRSKDSALNHTHAGFQMQNFPVSKLIQTLAARFPKRFPFIDDTGLRENIDLNVDALWTDFERVKQALYENGIEIKTSLKPMRVVVLRTQ